MATSALYILLCSGEHEKLQMAAMMASVAAVSERPVEVFVSMNAILAFAKDAPADERYQGGAFSKLLKEKRAPDAMTLFRQGRSWATSSCGPARWRSTCRPGKLDQLEEGLFDGALGLTKFLSDAENGQFVTLVAARASERDERRDKRSMRAAPSVPAR